VKFLIVDAIAKTILVVSKN